MMSHRARQTESSPVRALLVLGDEALRANVAAVIGGLPGVSETRAIASYGELLAERMDEFDAFIVGESFADAAATDVVGLIREHRDEAPILAALLEKRPWASTAWTPTLDDAERWVLANVRPDDLVLTVGAGDVHVLAGRLVDALTARVAAGRPG